MASTTPKTPNLKRKSLPNAAAGESAPNAKTPKLNQSLKTPGKGKGPAKGLNGKPQSPAAKSPKKVAPFKGTGAPKTGKKGAKIRQNKSLINLKEKVSKRDESCLKSIQESIGQLEAKKELTKSGKRKLKLLYKFRRVLTGEERPVIAKPIVAAAKKGVKKPKANPQAGKKEGKQQPKPVEEKVPEVADPEEDDESDDSDDVDASFGSIIKTEGSEGDSGDDDSEEEGEAGAPSDAAAAKQGKKTRYVVFVGNLAYDATKEEIKEHFSKAGDVIDVRIQKDQSNKPRGFAYVEFSNEASYLKGLSLHNTFIKGRRVNVQYTQSGKKKGPQQKKEIKSKNLKFQAMKKQGQLGGPSPNQKRGARRANNKPKTNGV